MIGARDVEQAESLLVASVERWWRSLTGHDGGCDARLVAAARVTARAAMWLKAEAPASQRSWDVLALAKREVVIRKNELIEQRERELDPTVAEYESMIDALPPIEYPGGRTPHGCFERIPAWVIDGAL